MGHTLGILEVTYLNNNFTAKEGGSTACEVHECEVDGGVGLGTVHLEVLHRPTQQRLNLLVVVAVFCLCHTAEEVCRVNYNTHQTVNCHIDFTTTYTLQTANAGVKLTSRPRHTKLSTLVSHRPHNNLDTPNCQHWCHIDLTTT